MLRKEDLALVADNRVGGMKQRMCYAKLAESQLPIICLTNPTIFPEQIRGVIASIENAEKASEAQMPRDQGSDGGWRTYVVAFSTTPKHSQ